MLNICVIKGSEIDVMFNAKKSVLFVTGLAVLYWCCCLEWKYKVLGYSFLLWVHFRHRPDISHMMRKFYAAANAICGHVKFASDMSRLLLMESFCLPLLSYWPLLSYCCEAMQYSRRQLQQLNVCWNNAYRKVSGMHSWAFCERNSVLLCWIRLYTYICVT